MPTLDIKSRRCADLKQFNSDVPRFREISQHIVAIEGNIAIVRDQRRRLGCA